MLEKIYHRGLSSDEGKDSPNSFEGFSDRYDRQIELDVFLLKDGTLAVLHNNDFKLEQKEVEGMTLEELQNLDKSEHNDSEGALVPIFEEFAFGCLDRGNGLVIELKASSPEMAKKLAKVLVEKISTMSKEDETFSTHQDYVKELGIHSFSIEALEEAKKVMDIEGIEIPMGLFWTSSPEKAPEMDISATAIEHASKIEGLDWTDKGIEIAHQLGVDYIDLHWSVLNTDVVKKAHQKSLKVVSWVVNDEEKMKELEEMGVDKIVTER